MPNPIAEALREANANAETLLRQRIEALIAYNRALLAVTGVLLLLMVAGWSSIGPRLDSAEKFKKDQAEWNQLILRALWLMNDDPKRKKDYDTSDAKGLPR